MLAACSRQESASEPEADSPNATPSASVRDSAMEDMSAENADAAMDAVERVTYPFENPNGETEKRVVYFARETEDRIRIRQGGGESQTYVACPDQ
jgi:hypothetical protein